MEEATFYPRRKAWSSDKECLKRTSSLPKPVIVTRGALEALMPLSLTKAACKMGLSPTTFKKACRQVGIYKWPYRPDYEKRNKTTRTPPLSLSTSASSPASLPLSPTMSERRATTSHGLQKEGADTCHTWPSPPSHAWPSPPSSQPRIAAPSHYTISPSIVFPHVPGAAHELRPSVVAVLEYLEDFGLVGGHLASLMGLVDE